MATQQTKKRRKRYQPGSAFAGDVKPRGVFRLFGNVRLFFIVGAAIMVGSLFVGGVLQSDTLFGGSNAGKNTDFVLPEETTSSATPATAVPTPKRYTAVPAMTIDPAKSYTATIKTALGDIEVELFAGQTPQTVNNFVFLAQDGFYNGLTFWTVTPNFDAQAGDPNCKAGDAGGCAGSGDPGYELPQEKPGGTYTAGTLGMANASQFFIAFADDPQFASFTPFGQVTSGLDIAQQLTAGTAIESITITEQ
jgi:cyclophilin family peptidyl-prolyl cis-trans isomerase